MGGTEEYRTDSLEGWGSITVVGMGLFYCYGTKAITVEEFLWYVLLICGLHGDDHDNDVIISIHDNPFQYYTNGQTYTPELCLLTYNSFKHKNHLTGLLKELSYQTKHIIGEGCVMKYEYNKEILLVGLHEKE